MASISGPFCASLARDGVFKRKGFYERRPGFSNPLTCSLNLLGSWGLGSGFGVDLVKPQLSFLGLGTFKGFTGFFPMRACKLGIAERCTSV